MSSMIRIYDAAVTLLMAVTPCTDVQKEAAPKVFVFVVVKTLHDDGCNFGMGCTALAVVVGVYRTEDLASEACQSEIDNFETVSGEVYHNGGTACTTFLVQEQSLV
jgi:hypothetical protein